MDVKKLLVMPDFCSTGLWICNTEDLRDHENVDYEEICEEGLLFPEELYKECLEWVDEYDRNHDKVNYVFISENAWKKSYEKGLNIAKKIKEELGDNAIVYFWMEGFKTDEFFKEEIV